MAYDPVRGRVVLFGGTDGATYPSDTWAWDGAEWTLLFAGDKDVTPFADSAMAWDPASRSMLLLGGAYNGALSSTIWRLGSQGWTRLDDLYPVRAATLATLPATQSVYGVGGTFINGPQRFGYVPGQSPARLVAHPQDQSAPATGSACFTVDAHATAPIAYQWRKDGVDLADDARVSGSTSATLCVAALEAGDAAAYSVVVSNSAGVTTTRDAILTVLAPACPADLSGDGLVGSPDLAEMLGAWNGGPGPADITGDGLVNSQDLAAMLGAWGACPE
jgi:hypothetical protein